MPILFLTTVLPAARRSGGEIASQAFVDGLRGLGHTVVVLAYRRVGDQPLQHDDDVVVADRRIETGSAGGRPLIWMARALAARRPYSAAKYVTRAYRRSVAEQLEAAVPSLVIIDHAQMGWAASVRARRGGLVYLAHNVEHRVYSDAEASGLRRLVNMREARLVQRDEAALCQRAAAVWSLTADDAEALARLGGGGSNVQFDLPAAGDPPAPGPATCDVAMLGSWTWRPNAAGLRWFIDEVSPKLTPGTTVEIGGPFSEQMVGNAPALRARGRVLDAMAFLQSARVVVVPSVAGGGVQVKTLDAIATGRAVVASQTAMRGIADPPPTVRVAADARGFADAVKEALAAAPSAAQAELAQVWARNRRARFADQLRAALEQVGAGQV